MLYKWFFLCFTVYHLYLKITINFLIIFYEQKKIILLHLKKYIELNKHYKLII